MGDKSAIEWTDATWNPIFGCSKVSPGCAHCYAETFALTRLKGKPGYTGLPWTPENAAANVSLRPDRMDQPLRWRRPRRIFVNSLSDVFHERFTGLPDEVTGQTQPWLEGEPPRPTVVAQIFAVMSLAPQHTFQVLTKRPRAMRAILSHANFWLHVNAIRLSWGHPVIPGGISDFATGDRVLANVWLGTSVENQHWADERIPHLLETPAAVRFLSCEPLLGPVDLRAVPLQDGDMLGNGLYSDGAGACLDWVIAGGESGPKHRPLDLDWARTLRDQCVGAGVPFLFKQVGGRTSKAGGRELDGRTWDQFPQVCA